MTHDWNVFLERLTWREVKAMGGRRPITSVEQLISLTEQQFRLRPGVGPSVLSGVRRRLKDFGLSFKETT